MGEKVRREFIFVLLGGRGDQNYFRADAIWTEILHKMFQEFSHSVSRAVGLSVVSFSAAPGRLRRMESEGAASAETRGSTKGRSQLTGMTLKEWKSKISIR